MCSSDKFFAVLVKNCAVQKYAIQWLAQRCKNINSSKNDRYRYEMIG